jgi:two-component system chemotaxis response regulator CheB
VATRVLVVDDTAVFRRIVSEALASLPGVEVVGVAANGKLALARMAALHPDLITLDIEMPEMNGLEVLQAMAAAGSKAGVIVLSALTVRGGEMTVRALELGAFDFVTKPEAGSPEQNLALIRSRLLPMIRAFSRRPANPQPCPTEPRPRRAEHVCFSTSGSGCRPTGPPIVLIGVSTGGPNALAELLPALPSDLPAPVFIVQHMPPLFTQALAANLQAKSAIRIREATHGEAATPGRVYLAPGGRQMKLTAGPRGQIIVEVTNDPPENNCRPSVDYLFRSVALQFPGRAIAAILTGMGNDGAEGLRLLKRGGCCSMAQDEATCVVFGMPREAILAGVVDKVLPLAMIAPTIVRSVGELAH